MVSEDAKLSQSDRLNEELGIFSLNDKLQQLFIETEQLRVSLEERLTQMKGHKLCMIVEDKYDQIYKIAWLKLNDIEFDKDNLSEVFDEKCHFKIFGMESAGSVSGLLRSKNASLFDGSKIVGVYDFDKEGAEQFHFLKREVFWADKVEGQKSNGHYRVRSDAAEFYSMLLPVPDRLSSLADLGHDNFSNYIEVENLLSESFLLGNKYVDEKTIVGVRYLKIRDNCKKSLWEKLIGLSKDQFLDFTPLYSTFDELTKD